MATFNIWGVTIKDEIRNGQLYWQLFIRSPFELPDHKLRYGINEKIIEKAQESGVYEFLVGNVPIRVPSKKGLREKNKKKEFELKESKFGKPFKIYYFII